MYVYIYIEIDRERERDACTYLTEREACAIDGIRRDGARSHLPALASARPCYAYGQSPY